MLIINKF